MTQVVHSRSRSRSQASLSHANKSSRWDMWKFFGKRFGRSSGASVSQTPSGSVADLRGKFFLEKHCTHGFPLGPTCMTYDPHRRVLFIGTSSGEIRMLGQPGVELTGLHDDDNRVLQILPFASEPSIITVCANNIMHKWSLLDGEGNARLVLKRTYKFQGGLAKTITTCCLPPYCDCLFVGTLGGITYPMDTEFDGMSPEVLSWSRARAYLHYRGKDVPGEVKSLEINPVNPKQLLIGYDHSYLELWNALTWKPVSLFGPFKENDVGDLLTMCWHSSGDQFITTHKDGTIAFWNLSEPAKPFKLQRVHGNERIQDITNIFWPSENMFVMSGGGPSSVVDGESVTIMDHNETVSLQLTSPVKGMHILEDQQADRDSGIVNYTGSDADNSATSTTRKILVLLLEQEILFVDLTLPDLNLLQPPYLNSVHSSPVKCVEVYTHVSKENWQIIAQVGRVQQEAVFRGHAKKWPIEGGLIQPFQYDKREMLISGHEDGSIKFWDIRDISMNLMYVLNSSQFFSSLDSDFFRSDSPDEDEEPGPKTKRIGFWDPRSDDDQVQVTCVQFFEDQLIIGYQGGVVLLFDINNQSMNAMVKLQRVSILRDDPRQRGRNWQAPLEIRTDGIECAPGYQPSHCVGLFPNVPVTCAALAKDQHLLAVGCVYGFAVVDYLKGTTIHVHSTYDEATPDPGGLSRMQSIRKSFRQSLKRLNVRRSMRGMQSTNRSYRPSFVRSGSMRPSMKNRTQGGVVAGGANAQGGSVLGSSNEGTPVPLRRDSVRTVSFTAPCHISGHSTVHSVLVGTNQGGVLAYTLDMPAAKHRGARSPIMMPIDKEFNQKRNLATLFVGVLDSHCYLLDINDKGSYHASSKGTHYMVIVTEDAIKVLGLPSMKKKYRVKLKQHDGDEHHIVSAHYQRVTGHSAILVMDSEGFISVYSLPDLKFLYKEDCVDASDAMGQRNFVVSADGTLLHQRSPSEFTRGSVTEESRMEFHFSLPTKHISPLMLTPNTPKSIANGEPIFEVTHHQIGPNSPLKTVSADVIAELEMEDIDSSDDQEKESNSATQFPFGETSPSSAADSTFSERAL